MSYTKAILRPADVSSILAISIPSLYRWIKLGHFPKPIKYGPNAVGWEQETVEAFIAERKAASQHVAA